VPPVSDLPSQISLREVGPRDGLQNEDPVPTEAKIELIDRLSATGVGRIEASLIGHDVQVTPAPRVPRAHRLVLGDHSKVQISS